MASVVWHMSYCKKKNNLKVSKTREVSQFWHVHHTIMILAESVIYPTLTLSQKIEPDYWEDISGIINLLKNKSLSFMIDLSFEMLFACNVI